MASPLVQFRISEEGEGLIEEARKRRGMKRADWLREVAVAAAEAELGRTREAGRSVADPYEKLLGR